MESFDSPSVAFLQFLSATLCFSISQSVYKEKASWKKTYCPLNFKNMLKYLFKLLWKINLIVLAE